MVTAIYPHGFWTNHEWARAVINIDEEPVRPFRRVEKRSHRPAKRLIVACDDEHCDGFAIVLSSSDDQVPQKSHQRRTGCFDPRQGQAIAECESDPVAPHTVNPAFFDLNNATGFPLVMPHD